LNSEWSRKKQGQKEGQQDDWIRNLDDDMGRKVLGTVGGFMYMYVWIIRWMEGRMKERRMERGMDELWDDGRKEGRWMDEWRKKGRTERGIDG
jgi:hypothetical protein